MGDWNATLIAAVLSKNFWMSKNLSQKPLISRLSFDDDPGLISEHVVVEIEDNMKEIQPLPTWPPRKEALMVLSLLYSAVSASDADNGIMKAMDELQHFVTKVYKNCLQQRSTDSYFKKQWECTSI